jgi:hypothetical protein
MICCIFQVMNAWKRSKSPDALEKIESILKRMEDGFATSRTLDMRPTSLSYATVSSKTILFSSFCIETRSPYNCGVSFI